MPDAGHLVAFSLVCLGLVLTPGPNMVYLVSRSISQGRGAGLISLGGVALGFVCYMASAALGISAILLAVPFAYDALRFGGALYLLYLAWQAVRPGGRSPFQVREFTVDRPLKQFSMGFLTSLLNPKVAVMYVSLLPQFIDPANGGVLAQSLVLGSMQIAISVCVNTVFVLTAGSVATFFATRPFWAKVQRWVMASMLGALALRMAGEAQR